MSVDVASNCHFSPSMHRAGETLLTIYKEEQRSVLLPFSGRETRDIQDGSQISKTRVHNTDDAT